MNRGRQKSIRFRWFGMGLVLVVGLASSNGSLALAASAGQEEATRFIDGARKEGEVMWYASMALDDSAVLVKKFMEKYPFIKTKLYRASGSKLLERFLAEARAGTMIADVISADGLVMGVLKEKGLLQRYLSPERDAFPVGAKDPAGYWTDTYVNTFNAIYNTHMVPSPDVPTNYTDLLSPKWKGRMAVEGTDYEWLGGILQIMGEENGIEFMRKLAIQRPTLRNGSSLIAMLVAAGEFAIFPNGYPRRVEVLRERGAYSVDWVWMEPVIAQLHPTALAAKASHPNAAKLLIDYLLSREGQELIGQQFGRLPSRPGIKLKYPRMGIEGRKVHWSDPVVMAKNANRYAELFQGIFVRQK